MRMFGRSKRHQNADLSNCRPIQFVHRPCHTLVIIITARRPTSFNSVLHRFANFPNVRRSTPFAIHTALSCQLRPRSSINTVHPQHHIVLSTSSTFVDQRRPTATLRHIVSIVTFADQYCLLSTLRHIVNIVHVRRSTLV